MDFVADNTLKNPDFLEMDQVTVENSEDEVVESNEIAPKVQRLPSYIKIGQNELLNHKAKLRAKKDVEEAVEIVIKVEEEKVTVEKTKEPSESKQVEIVQEDSMKNAFDDILENINAAVKQIESLENSNNEPPSTEGTKETT
jgi:hypothetical protein